MLRKTLKSITSKAVFYFFPKSLSSGRNCSIFSSDFQKMADATSAISQLGYAFNAEGQLRKLGNDKVLSNEPYQYDISNDPEECQACYEKLGVAVTNYVYELLEAKEKMVCLPTPKGTTSDNGTFIFVSRNYDLKDILMVLIHGSGAVRAGQWSRALIINESLEVGTQIPYVKKAIAKDYGVMILNPNDNCRGKDQKIPYNSTPEEHAKYVWDNYIKKTKASKILIVAHSYGGVVTVSLANQFKQDFKERVKAIALTDSVHGFSNFKVNDYLKQVSKNWISSSEPLDTLMKTPKSDITRVSAGHPRHEMTSSKCVNSVFTYFEEKLSTK